MNIGTLGMVAEGTSSGTKAITDIKNKKRSISTHPRVNVGTLGMVADGKSAATKSITGQETQKSSKEMKDNKTLKIGYADSKIYKIGSELVSRGFDPDDNYNKASDSSLVRHISIIDCPGHYDLILTMMGSVDLMNVVLIVVAANSPIKEKASLIQHLRALKLSGIDKIIVCLNKIDLMKGDRKLIMKRYDELKSLLEKFEIVPSYPIIPTCFSRNIGVEKVLDAICTVTSDSYSSKSTEDKKEYFLSNRSFDVNLLGTQYDNLVGVCLGGTLMGGSLKIGDEISVRPGIYDRSKNEYKEINTVITSLKYGNSELSVINSGGLTSIGTEIAPFIGRNNGLSGKIIGKKKNLPSVFLKLIITDIKTGMFYNDWSPAVNSKVSLQIKNQIVKSRITEEIDNVEEVAKQSSEGDEDDRPVEKRWKFNLEYPVCISPGDFIIFIRTKKNMKEPEILGYGSFHSGEDQLE